jgi:Rieske Fe-S protein
MGRDNEWETLYDPTRKTLRAATKFAAENLNVAAQYADLVTAGDLDSRNQIKAGEGAIIRRGLKKIAVYRDDTGALHERSAVCVHLGCIVDWNSKEKTWDCPCHGSRYDARGKVFQGPANRDLIEMTDH